MRLIDVNKMLPDACLATALDKGESFYSYFYSENRIKNAPTVKAIPIEWIKNKIAVSVHLWEEGKDEMFIEDGVAKIVSYSLTAQVLSQMLELWEAENGRKTNDSQDNNTL